jgi:RNA polymerase sigma-70 factor (ECF subfamily)
MESASSFIDAQQVVMVSSMGFAELYERHYAAVYHAALRITGNPADAEDVLQTVFLRILNRGGRLDSAQSLEAYLRRAAANAALDLLRRRVSHGEVPLEEDAARYKGENTALLKERLRRAIAALEEGDAILFLLRYVEGMSNGELATMFGQEKNNIAVRLHRIRQALQAEMER